MALDHDATPHTLDQRFLRNIDAELSARVHAELTPLEPETATQATRESADFTVASGRTLSIAVVVANLTGTPTYTPSLQWKYDGTDYVTFWTASSALSADGVALYEIGAAAAGDGDEAVAVPLKRTMRLVLTAASADGENNADTSAHINVGV